MKTTLIIFASLCLWLRAAMGVIQNGVITFDPVQGATRYTLWKVLPGQSAFIYVASFDTNRYAVGPVVEGTAFYLRSVTPSAGGQYYVESDFGFVVTPPAIGGTNVLRFSGHPSTLFKLQSAPGAAGPWVDIGIYNGTPLQLQLKRVEFLRSVKMTNPPPPGGGP